MLVFLAALALAAGPAYQFAPYHLDRLAVADARGLNGTAVVVWLEVGKPLAFTHDGRTLIGIDDQADGVERGVVLRRERDNIDVGDRLTVGGVLRVLDHAAATVNGVEVPAWVEVRVEQGE